ncbi:MAG: DUF3987 domain-containing protein [Alphaproteobacteria bacterium]|nr:DUF3987 domain-containing protein [Alphaproteobacteria bacterium]
MTAQQVKDIIANTIEISKPSPEPLRKALQPPTEFPIDSLTPILKETVLAINDKTQAPIPLCAQSVLSAVNLAVQGHINIKMPFGEEKPISCFFLTIAESGERKTSCDNIVLKTVKVREEELRKQYKLDFFKWKNNNDSWEKQRKNILKSEKYPDYNSRQNALNRLGEAPESPLTPLLICPEPTFEGLCKLMINSIPSLGVFSSEGGQFIGGYAMNPENKIRTAAALSGLWDGEDIKRVRSGDGTIILAGKRLNIHLMVQPSIGINFLSDLALKDQGLFSRLLISSPQSTIGTRLQRVIKPQSINALSQFDKHMNHILQLELPIKDCGNNELNPRTIEMDDNALKLYQEFCDHIEMELAPDKQLASIKGFANKLPEHVCRIAATLAAFDDIEFSQLECHYIKIGIEIALYYASEALRLFDNGVINPDILLAEKLLDWLQNKWNGGEYISLPDIYQKGLNAISTKSVASRITTILENHGWLQKQQDQMVVKSKTRKEVFKIIKN